MILFENSHFNKCRFDISRVCLNLFSALFLAYSFIVAIVLVFFSFVTVECEVVGSSMYPTLNKLDNDLNDTVFINSYNRDIGYGDIVVISLENQAIIKRVVGMQGDRICIDVDTNSNNIYRLKRNGEFIEENYLNIDGGPTIPTNEQNGMVESYKKFQDLKQKFPDHFNSKGELIIPQNSIFAMGDNRRVSLDSTTYGPFELSQVDGKVEYYKFYEQTTFSFYYDYIVQGEFIHTFINCFNN